MNHFSLFKTILVHLELLKENPPNNHQSRSFGTVCEHYGSSFDTIWEHLVPLRNLDNLGRQLIVKDHLETLPTIWNHKGPY